MANLKDFKVGDRLLTYGFDMQCHKCVAITQIVARSKSGIVTMDENDGCRTLTTWKQTKYANGYFLYSKEQEAMMQQHCNKLKKQWLEYCKKQIDNNKK